MNRLFLGLTTVFALLLVYSCKSDEYEEWRIMNENWYNSAKISYADSIGYQMTSSGLIYKILEPGYQRRPNDNSIICIKYTGKLITGTVFSKDSALFEQRNLVAGWREAMKLIKDGGHIKFVLPYQIGYGKTEALGVLPYSTLIFDVKLYWSVD
jgi:FKBP-type peptidyl-prolyl cis-trans isomerase